MQERHENSSKSALKGHKDAEGTGGKAERGGIVQSGEEKAWRGGLISL